MTALLVYVVLQTAVNKKSLGQPNIAPIPIGQQGTNTTTNSQQRTPTMPSTSDPPPSPTRPHTPPHSSSILCREGFAVFLAHVVLIPIDGCSINPTRSFGPAVVASAMGSTNVWDDMWVFWAAPLLGAAVS